MKCSAIPSPKRHRIQLAKSCGAAEPVDWLDEAAQRSWRARYSTGVRVLDKELGRFFGYLEEDGWLDRSLLVVTSDHGEELSDHGGWDHGWNFYEHQLHVPLLVRPPRGERRRS